LAQFYLTSLEDKTTPREIKDALRVFQDRAERKDHDRNFDMLAEAYDEVMTRINQQCENYRRKAHQVLSWVCYANRELYARELQAAIAVREHEFDVHEDDLSDISLLLSVCCGTIVLGKATQTIQLVHYTAQDYFILKEERWFPDVQSYLAKQCINYLSLEKFKDGLPVSTNNRARWLPFDPNKSQDIEPSLGFRYRRRFIPGWFAFYEYAAVYWGHHVRRATISASNVDRAVLNLLHSEKKINAAMKVQLKTRGPDRFPVLDSKTERLSVNGLHLAAFCGFHRVIPLLMMTFEVSSKDLSGRTALSWASKAGWCAIVKRLLLAGADFEAVDDGGHTSLHSAAESNHAEVVQLLINAGVNVQAVNSYGDTALHFAARSGHIEVMQLLINAGANVQLVNSSGDTALHHAARSGANVQLVNSGGDTALHYTARSGHIEVMQLLINAGANVQLVNSGGDTALHYTAQSGHIEVVQLLINAGANVRLVDSSGNTALHYAARSGHVEVVQLLINAGANVQLVNSSGDTALHYAARLGRNAIANLLLINGARHDVSNRDGQVPLNLAVRGGSRSVYETLCKMGANPRSCGDDRRTVLMEAAWCKDEALVTTLLKEKFDFEAQDHYDRTALMEACEGGNQTIVEALLQHNARLDIQDHAGHTALMKACEKGHQTIVEALLQHNARLDILDHAGHTALMKAIGKEDWEVASQLLLSDSLQKYPYLKTIYDGAALLHASANFQEPIVKVLLEKRALYSAEAHNGLPFLAALIGEHKRSEGFESIIQLLLHLGIDLTHRKDETSRKLMVQASKHGNEELVRWLIRQGISVHGADERHETPLVAAARARQKSMVKLLRAEGARFTNNPYTK
jgi:ankyrin repeat protein